MGGGEDGVGGPLYCFFWCLAHEIIELELGEGSGGHLSQSLRLSVADLDIQKC